MAKEKAILISTHTLEEVSVMCTRAVIIDHGRLVADGTPEELAQRSSGGLEETFIELVSRKETETV